MDNGHPPVNAAAAFSLAADFQPFCRLPPELRVIIWGLALEQAIAEFKSRFPAYARVWLTSHRTPYLKYHVPDLPPLVLQAVKELFRGLFWANKFSHDLTIACVSMMHERGRLCGLTLKFVDMFAVNSLTLKQLIVHTKYSDENLRTLVGAELTPPFPLPIMANYQQQLDDIASVTNLVVPYELFHSPDAPRPRGFVNERPQQHPDVSKACRELLLRLPNLKTVYVDLQSTVTTSQGEKDYQPYAYDRDFVELTEIRNGEIKFKWDDIGSFEQGYSRILRERAKEVFPSMPRRARNRCCISWAAQNFERQENWKRGSMEAFLNCWKDLDGKGIKCVIVGSGLKNCRGEVLKHMIHA
ncbi:hypothetical protein GGS26DRAFT_360612 [Hypomontagnella submonticulosa]|nr:hypothetical protein GGS26DRAFT_360612 [Hypomontagnella submonticulosa]